MICTFSSFATLIAESPVVSVTSSVSLNVTVAGMFKVNVESYTFVYCTVVFPLCGSAAYAVTAPAATSAARIPAAAFRFFLIFPIFAIFISSFN